MDETATQLDQSVTGHTALEEASAKKALTEDDMVPRAGRRSDSQAEKYDEEKIVARDMLRKHTL